LAEDFRQFLAGDLACLLDGQRRTRHALLQNALQGRKVPRLLASGPGGFQFVIDARGRLLAAVAQTLEVWHLPNSAHSRIATVSQYIRQYAIKTLWTKRSNARGGEGLKPPAG